MREQLMEKAVLSALALGAWISWALWSLRARVRRSRNRLARPGTVYVCSCCGKRSNDRYGELAIDDGWDESCMMHCFLARDRSLIFKDGRVDKAVAA